MFVSSPFWLPRLTTEKYSCRWEPLKLISICNQTETVVNPWRECASSLPKSSLSLSSKAMNTLKASKTNKWVNALKFSVNSAEPLCRPKHHKKRALYLRHKHTKRKIYCGRRKQHLNFNYSQLWVFWWCLDDQELSVSVGCQGTEANMNKQKNKCDNRQEKYNSRSNEYVWNMNDFICVDNTSRDENSNYDEDY